MDDNEMFEETDLGLLGDDDWTGLFSPTNANSNSNIVEKQNKQDRNDKNYQMNLNNIISDDDLQDLLQFAGSPHHRGHEPGEPMGMGTDIGMEIDPTNHQYAVRTNSNSRNNINDSNGIPLNHLIKINTGTSGSNSGVGIDKRNIQLLKKLHNPSMSKLMSILQVHNQKRAKPLSHSQSHSRANGADSARVYMNSNGESLSENFPTHSLHNFRRNCGSTGHSQLGLNKVRKVNESNSVPMQKRLKMDLSPLNSVPKPVREGSETKHDNADEDSHSNTDATEHNMANEGRCHPRDPRSTPGFARGSDSSLHSAKTNDCGIPEPESEQEVTETDDNAHGTGERSSCDTVEQSAIKWARLNENSSDYTDYAIPMTPTTRSMLSTLNRPEGLEEEESEAVQESSKLPEGQHRESQRVVTFKRPAPLDLAITSLPPMNKYESVDLDPASRRGQNCVKSTHSSNLTDIHDTLGAHGTADGGVRFGLSTENPSLSDSSLNSEASARDVHSSAREEVEIGINSSADYTGLNGYEEYWMSTTPRMAPPPTPKDYIDTDNLLCGPPPAPMTVSVHNRKVLADRRSREMKYGPANAGATESSSSLISEKTNLSGSLKQHDVDSDFYERSKAFVKASRIARGAHNGEFRMPDQSSQVTRAQQQGPAPRLDPTPLTLLENSFVHIYRPSSDSNPMDSDGACFVTQHIDQSKINQQDAYVIPPLATLLPPHVHAKSIGSVPISIPMPLPAPIPKVSLIHNPISNSNSYVNNSFDTSPQCATASPGLIYGTLESNTTSTSKSGSAPINPMSNSRPFHCSNNTSLGALCHRILRYCSGVNPNTVDISSRFMFTTQDYPHSHSRSNFHSKRPSEAVEAAHTPQLDTETSNSAASNDNTFCATETNPVDTTEKVPEHRVSPSPMERHQFSNDDISHFLGIPTRRVCDLLKILKTLGYLCNANGNTSSKATKGKKNSSASLSSEQGTKKKGLYSFIGTKMTIWNVLMEMQDRVFRHVHNNIYANKNSTEITVDMDAKHWYPYITLEKNWVGTESGSAKSNPYNGSCQTEWPGKMKAFQDICEQYLQIFLLGYDHLTIIESAELMNYYYAPDERASSLDASSETTDVNSVSNANTGNGSLIRRLGDITNILCALGYLIKYEVNVVNSDKDLPSKIKYHNELSRRVCIDDHYISMNSHVHVQYSNKTKVKHSIQNCFCWNYVSPHLLRKSFHDSKSK